MLTHLLSLTAKEEGLIVVNVEQIGAMIPEPDGTVLFIQGIKVSVKESIDEIVKKYNSFVSEGKP